MCCSLTLGGCAFFQEAGKKAWGSSTQALENARSEGKSLSLACVSRDCFDACLDILKQMEAIVFQQGKQKDYIIAMNFRGFTDTTEAGIFFDQKEDAVTTVQVSSLNPKLLESVAAEIFSGLKNKFSVVEVSAVKNPP